MNRPGFMRFGQLEEERSLVCDPHTIPPAEFFHPERLNVWEELKRSRAFWAVAAFFAGVACGAFLQAVSP